MAVCLQSPVGHELRLALLARDETHHVLVESRRQRVRIDVGDEAVAVALGEQRVEGLRFAAHGVSRGAALARAMYLSSRSMGAVGVRVSRPASCAKIGRAHV